MLEAIPLWASFLRHHPVTIIEISKIRFCLLLKRTLLYAKGNLVQLYLPLEMKYDLLVLKTATL